MPAIFRMPAVAAQTTEAILAEWIVGENVPYGPEDAIATVETDKATVDVEAEVAGVIVKYLVPPGTEVAVGAPIAVTRTEDEVIADLDEVLLELGVAGPESSPAVPAIDEAAAGDPRDAAPAPTPEATAAPERIFATPLVRRLAADADIDLREVTGTGPQGRIVRRDIETRLDAGFTPGTPAAAVPAAPSSAGSSVSPDRTARTAPAPSITGDYHDEPHSRMRKAIASRLAESKREAPHFYMSGTCRVDELLALRKKINATTDTSVSINDLLVKAAALAHRAVPAMNMIWTDESTRHFDTVDIAVAVASERGLLTPVVRDVARRSITAIATDLHAMAEQARAGKLAQHQLEGGALSISNLGMYGTEEFAAIINPPQSAILGIGAARQEAIVVDGELAVGTVMRVTLSVDHRPIDGATAAEWLRAFIAIVEAPLEILL